MHDHESDAYVAQKEHIWKHQHGAGRSAAAAARGVPGRYDITVTNGVVVQSFLDRRNRVVSGSLESAKGNRNETDRNKNKSTRNETNQMSA